MNGALRVVQHHFRVYQRTWTGSLFISFLSPVLYLVALGVGLGSLIARGSMDSLGGVSYASFVAPGLLAATTMMTAFSETTYPIMNRAYWLRTYDSMLATPLRVRDLLNGDVAWLTFRLATVAGIFFVVMAAFRTIHSPLAPLAILAAILTGLAFGLPVMAFAVTRRRDAGFAIIGRFVVTPLFVLGGAFFPISRLPASAQVLAWSTPLAHGIALSRDLTLGTATLTASVAHLAVVTAYIALGIAGASITFQRRLAS